VWSSRHLSHDFVPGVASLARTFDVSPTSCRPCARCFTNPSRPGRLIAVTASQDRDETPRTI